MRVVFSCFHVKTRFDSQAVYVIIPTGAVTDKPVYR